jgi:hypothetical protein
MSRISTLLAPLALSVIAACSGGSSGSDASGPVPTAGTVQLVFDSAAGSDARVTGTIQAVAFENAAGVVVGNQLDDPVDVVLADPDGAFSSVSVRDPGPDVYSKLHLVFAGGTVRLQHPDGQDERVQLSSANQVVPIDPQRVFPKDDDRIIVIVNRRPYTGGPGGNIVEPDLGGGPTDTVPVRYARMTVLSIDSVNRQLVAELSIDGAPSVDVLFAMPSLLLRDDAQLGVDDFLAGLSIGSTIQVVDGELETDAQGGRTLTVYAAVDLGLEDPNGNGRKSEVHGCIASIDSVAETFTLGLFTVDKGVHNLPDPLPGTLAVAADGARIKWVPRLGRHTGHLPFSALQVGMSVEVEWHGPALTGSVPAHKVDIRDEVASPLWSLGGAVTGVDATSDELTIELGDPLAVGSSSYASVRLALASDTLVLGGDATQVPIGRFQIGDVVFALARQDQDDRFVTTYVRIED